ncbi:MAG: AMP-binding protein [Eubacteriales bacterium]|nr:AMP-binding protein [Eubacteriales bacterium]
MDFEKPWDEFYKGIDVNINYPDSSLFGAVCEAMEKNPKATALVYMGRKITYSQLVEESLRFADLFRRLSVKPGEMVAVCLPNIPEAVYCLYGLSAIGAVSSFLHPLSAPMELDYYITELKARYVVTLDSLIKNFSASTLNSDVKFLIVSPEQSLSKCKKLLYRLSNKKISVPNRENIIHTKKLLSGCDTEEIVPVQTDKDSVAVVLFSGGTTGVPKGVMISNFSLNAMALQTARMSAVEVSGKSMLAAMPMFHGFGLAVCIHTTLISGGSCLLVPRFTPREYAKLIIRHKPNFIAGVPTLFEALLNCEELKKADLSCLLGVFSGGDTLPVDLKQRFDEFLKTHGAKVRIREGYGATECVTASCLTPVAKEKIGSIGIPFPDVLYKICKVGTTEQLPYGEQGEICISGPTLMMGYLSHEEETAKVLKTHEDGRIWLHTGDLGYIDREGFVYFRQRIKRIIVVSGYNVYPSQIERIFEAHESIKKCCVVAKRDAYKMHRVKLYAVPNDGFIGDDALRRQITEYAKGCIARYAIPKEIEFLESLPMTKYGKVDFLKLQNDANKETE